VNIDKQVRLKDIGYEFTEKEGVCKKTVSIPMIIKDGNFKEAYLNSVFVYYFTRPNLLGIDYLVRVLDDMHESLFEEPDIQAFQIRVIQFFAFPIEQSLLNFLDVNTANTPEKTRVVINLEDIPEEKIQKSGALELHTIEFSMEVDLNE